MVPLIDIHVICDAICFIRNQLNLLRHFRILFRSLKAWFSINKRLEIGLMKALTLLTFDCKISGYLCVYIDCNFKPALGIVLDPAETIYRFCIGHINNVFFLVAKSKFVVYDAKISMEISKLEWGRDSQSRYCS